MPMCNSSGEVSVPQADVNGQTKQNSSSAGVPPTYIEGKVVGVAEHSGLIPPVSTVSTVYAVSNDLAGKKACSELVTEPLVCSSVTEPPVESVDTAKASLLVREREDQLVVAAVPGIAGPPDVMNTQVPDPGDVAESKVEDTYKKEDTAVSVASTDNTSKVVAAEVVHPSLHESTATEILPAPVRRGPLTEEEIIQRSLARIRAAVARDFPNGFPQNPPPGPSMKKEKKLAADPKPARRATQSKQTHQPPKQSQQSQPKPQQQRKQAQIPPKISTVPYDTPSQQQQAGGAMGSHELSSQAMPPNSHWATSHNDAPLGGMGSHDFPSQQQAMAMQYQLQHQHEQSQQQQQQNHQHQQQQNHQQQAQQQAYQNSHGGMQLPMFAIPNEMGGGMSVHPDWHSHHLQQQQHQFVGRPTGPPMHQQQQMQNQSHKRQRVGGDAGHGGISMDAANGYILSGNNQNTNPNIAAAGNNASYDLFDQFAQRVIQGGGAGDGTAAFPNQFYQPSFDVAGGGRSPNPHMQYPGPVSFMGGGRELPLPLPFNPATVRPQHYGYPQHQQQHVFGEDEAGAGNPWP